MNVDMSLPVREMKDDLRTAPLIVPCLWLNDQAEEAAEFYIETFGAGRVIGRALFPDSFDNPGGLPRGGLMSVDFEVLGQRFTALNGGQVFTINPSISFFVYVDSPAAAARTFEALSSGGETLMPLDAYPWSSCYGWTADRFGVSWQVMTVAGAMASEAPRVAPSWLFCGDQFGNAALAMQSYCSVFPNSRIVDMEKYGADEAGEGSVKQGRFVLAHQSMVAMDSPIDHGFGFNEAVSLQVLCDGQEAIDHYWRTLSSDGAPGQCGWLKDRFGVSWQVVPQLWLDWLGSGADAAARERVFQAMLPMTKLDVAALEREFDAGLD